MKLKLVYSIVFLYSVFSVVYLAKITEFSPVYLVSICLVIPSVVTLLKFNLNYISLDVRLALIILVYVATVNIVNIQSIKTGEFINLFTGLFSYIFIRMNIFRISKKQYFLILKSLFWVAILLLSIDSIYRILNPTHPNKEVIDKLFDSDSWFYLYKFNSIMFADSNTTAIICLVLISSIFGLNNFGLNKFKIEKYLLIIILFSCFSRSSVIALIITYYFYTMKFSFKRAKYYLFLISIIVFLILNLYLNEISDGSFSSKLFLADLFISRYNELSLFELIFGLGLGNSEAFLGFYAHIFLLSWFLETGFIGLTLISIFLYTYAKNIEYLIITSTMVAGLSYFLYLGTPFLFIPMALIANLKTINHESSK